MIQITFSSFPLYLQHLFNKYTLLAPLAPDLYHSIPFTQSCTILLLLLHHVYIFFAPH